MEMNFDWEFRSTTFLGNGRSFLKFICSSFYSVSYPAEQYFKETLIARYIALRTEFKPTLILKDNSHMYMYAST